MVFKQDDFTHVTISIDLDFVEDHWLERGL